MAEIKKIRIGDMLLSANAITDAQLQEALKEQKSTGQRLGRILTDLGFVAEDKMLNLLSYPFNLQH